MRFCCLSLQCCCGWACGIISVKRQKKILEKISQSLHFLSSFPSSSLVELVAKGWYLPRTLHYSLRNSVKDRDLEIRETGSCFEFILRKHCNSRTRSLLWCHKWEFCWCSNFQCFIYKRSILILGDKLNEILQSSCKIHSLFCQTSEEKENELCLSWKWAKEPLFREWWEKCKEKGSDERRGKMKIYVGEKLYEEHFRQQVEAQEICNLNCVF